MQEGEITINRGDSCYFTVIKQNEEGTKINFDIGDELTFSAKKTLKQENYDIQVISTDLNDGEITIQLLPEHTNIALGQYLYDIQYKDIYNDIYTLSKGTLNIEWDVTT